MSFEVYDETTDSGLPDEAQAHLEAAYDAISNGDGARGLQEVEAALQIAPDYPALLNYKGNALRLLGRMDEADAVVRALIETAPDYLFAHVGMADICLREERFDDALGWLKPLLARERFHISEFRAIALTYIQLHLAMDQPDKALMWLGMMEDIDPDGVPPMLATQAAMLNAVQSLLRRTRKGK
jgi:tetratricopeptide (TPR) repeat protein